MEEELLSLADFVALESTIALNGLNTERVRQFVAENPRVRMGRALGSGFVPLYVNVRDLEEVYRELGGHYTLFPTILSPVDDRANRAAGIASVLEHPYLGLDGRGVVIGIVDTGIDYTKDCFTYEDGSTKILSIWDQTGKGARRDSLYYGAEYSKEDIEKALASENPYEIVPQRDEDGHGTFLASVAAGRKTDSYCGSAPGASLVVVKLRRAHGYFVDSLLLPPDKPNYFQNADVMLGVQYIIDVAEAQKAPVVICLGLGSNDTGHDGYSLFEEYISYLSQRAGYCVVTAAGNESRASHHCEGTLFRTGFTDVIGIRVDEALGRTSFSVNIYGAAYDKISVGITSPTGEVVGRVPFQTEVLTKETLLFDKTQLTVSYFRGVNTVIRIGFRGAIPGLWEVNLYGDFIIAGEYHAWLPMSYQVDSGVTFVDASPEFTIVYPGNGMRSITCGAFDMEDSSIYSPSSWGPTRLPRIAPDFVAPGVKVGGYYPWGYGTMTGTSVAAAVTAGGAALLMEWGIVEGNLPSMDGDLVRVTLIGGAEPWGDRLYPNVQWGYGKLSLMGSFLSMGETKQNYDMGNSPLLSLYP